MATLTKTNGSTKKRRLVARVSEDDKLIITQAAALTGQTVSSFVLVQSRRAAFEAVEARNRLILNAKESRQFVEALLAKPRSPNARMKRAMKLHDRTVSSDV